MSGFGSASLFLKIALVVTGVGFLFQLIGFASPYWQNISLFKWHSGLWKSCSGASCGNIVDNSYNPSWFEATQAFATLGFIAGLAALVLIILYVFVEKCSQKIVLIITIIANFAAFGCIFLAIVIYGAKTQDYLSWAYAFSIIGMILHGVSGGLLVGDMLQK